MKDKEGDIEKAKLAKNALGVETFKQAVDKNTSKADLFVLDNARKKAVRSGIILWAIETNNRKMPNTVVVKLGDECSGLLHILARHDNELGYEGLFEGVYSYCLGRVNEKVEEQVCVFFKQLGEALKDNPPVREEAGGYEVGCTFGKKRVLVVLAYDGYVVTLVPNWEYPGDPYAAKCGIKQIKL